MSPQLTRVLISFQQPFDILDSFQVVFKVFLRNCLRIFVIFNGKEEIIIIVQFIKSHLIRHQLDMQSRWNQFEYQMQQQELHS